MLNMLKQKKLSIVIPVYNNSESVKETCERILKTQQNSFSHLALEIIFVDDGSKDNSWDVLQNIKDEHQNIVMLIKLSRNFGQFYAMLAGYESCTGDAIITISADLQDPIEVMAKMVIEWEKGMEIVAANRQNRTDSFSAKLFSFLAYTYARKVNPNIPEGGFDYYLVSRKALDLLNTFKGRHRFIQGDILWLGLPTVFIPYVRNERPFGKSGYTFFKKLKSFTDVLLDSYFHPMRIAIGLGFLAAFLGFLYAIDIFISYFISPSSFVAGWSPIMIILLVFGGIIMLMLGVIGEYLWRLFDDSKGRPYYVIESQLKAELNSKKES